MAKASVAVSRHRAAGAQHWEQLQAVVVVAVAGVVDVAACAALECSKSDCPPRVAAPKIVA